MFPAYATLRAQTSHRAGVVTLSIQIGDGQIPAGSFRAEIRPNRSMSSRNLVVMVICLTVVCLTIGLSFFSLGLWLVLPFAGLEIFVVGVVVGYTIRRSDDHEVVLVTEDDVVVTKHEGRLTREAKFQKYWAWVRLEPGITRMQPSRLKIGSHGRFVEIGKAIEDRERRELSARLKQVLRAAV